MMGFSGSMVPMLWPKAQEMLRDLISNDDIIGDSVTFTTQGMAYKFADGNELLITPETSYDEFMLVVAEIKGKRNGK